MSALLLYVKNCALTKSVQSSGDRTSKVSEPSSDGLAGLATVFDWEEARAKLLCATPGLHVWEWFHRPPGKLPLLPRRCGQLVLCTTLLDGAGQAWIGINMYLLEPLTNRGLMRQLVTKLHPTYYPVMCSCPSGTTSEDAHRMWEAVGAIRYSTAQAVNGFVWLLR